MEELVGKTVKVVKIEPGFCAADKRWEGTVGKVKKVSNTSFGYQLWIEGMPVAVLADSDEWAVVE